MRRRFILLLLPLLLVCACPVQAKAEDRLREVPEYTMKAAYLYNFAQLTDWPDQTVMNRQTFNLCVIGQNEVLTALEPLRGRTIDGRPLKPMRLTEAAEVRHCDLLYVGEGEEARGNRLLDGLRGTPVLTVTDDRQVARYGAMLLIVTEGRRLAFDVNLDAAKRSQIRFSSKLLRLANRVSGE